MTIGSTSWRISSMNSINLCFNIEENMCRTCDGEGKVTLTRLNFDCNLWDMTVRPPPGGPIALTTCISWTFFINCWSISYQNPCSIHWRRSSRGGWEPYSSWMTSSATYTKHQRGKKEGWRECIWHLLRRKAKTSQRGKRKGNMDQGSQKKYLSRHIKIIEKGDQFLASWRRVNSFDTAFYTHFYSLLHTFVGGLCREVDKKLSEFRVIKWVKKRLNDGCFSRSYRR